VSSTCSRRRIYRDIPGGIDIADDPTGVSLIGRRRRSSLAAVASFYRLYGTLTDATAPTAIRC